MSFRIIPLALICSSLTIAVRAEEPQPLKVLWCTGGGFHDYKGLTPLLTEGIQKYANVEFDVSWDYKAWAKKGFADKYDAIVQFHSVHDKDLAVGNAIADNIAATVHAGKPALIIHGALHSFRELKEKRSAYCEAIGLTSTAHDKAGQIATRKLIDHPVTRFWPDDWKTGSDELYQNIKLWPNATGLLAAHSQESKKDHVVAWTNHYGKGRIFGTTLGHGKPTTDMETYHRLLANGLLWACDKLDDNGQPKPGYRASQPPK
jgi:type 1 glutamine amidotransferase